MKPIPKKNYFILVFLLLGTIFITLILANVYISKNKVVSVFYEVSNKITGKEFDEYIIENPDAIIYISDKYDLTNESKEEQFSSKLENLNLRDKLVFIDKKDVTKTFINNLKTNYNVNIDLGNTPILLVVIDKEIIKKIYIDENTNINTFIDYEVFE